MQCHTLLLSPPFFQIIFLLTSLGKNIESISLPTTNNQKQQQPRRTVPGQLSLVTWNVLAQEYVTPYKYPWATATTRTTDTNSDVDVLQWSHRKKRILQQIQTKLEYPDILCFQEVDIANWHQDFKHDLYDIGYTQSVVQCRKSDKKDPHPIVNVVAVKNNCGLEILRSESRSRAIIAVLKYCHNQMTNDAEATTRTTNNNSTSMIYVANVHLDAQSTKTNTRYNQLSSLFKRISKQCQLDHVAPRKACVLIAGDFNFEPNDQLYHWMTTTTAAAPFIPSRIPLVVSSPKQKKGNTKRKRKKKKAVEAIRFTKRLLDENENENTFLPLIDVYQHSRQHYPKVPLQFTFGAGIILDYIFASLPLASLSSIGKESDDSAEENTSTQIQTLRTLPKLPYFHESGDNVCDEQQSMNDEINCRYERTNKTSPSREQPFLPIPSCEFPSDHIPIGIVFEFS